MNTPKLLFTDKSLPFILEAMDKSINADGLIVETKTGEPILTPKGEMIKASEFGGFKKSYGFFKNDLHSLMEFTDHTRENDTRINIGTYRGKRERRKRKVLKLIKKAKKRNNK